MEVILNILKEQNCERIVLYVHGGHTVFVEIVNTLKCQLVDGGINCTVSNAYDFSNKETLYIIYNAHNFFGNIPSGTKYCIFNYEQASSAYVKYDHYLAKMHKAVAVFDYSYYNKEHLEKVLNREVTVVPYSYHPSLTVNAQGSNEEIDVLFYGCRHPRRELYKDILVKAGLNVKFVFDYNLFGANLMEEIKHAKMILNIHYYTNPSILEVSRIIPLISNHKLVLSERSDDVQADLRFKDMIEFFDESNIVELCKKYLDEDVRDKKIKQAFDLFVNETL